MSAMSAFMQFLPNHLAHCVAAHPIAGSDKSGAVSAHTGLFKQKKSNFYVLTTINLQAA